MICLFLGQFCAGTTLYKSAGIMICVIAQTIGEPLPGRKQQTSI